MYQVALRDKVEASDSELSRQVEKAINKYAKAVEAIPSRFNVSPAEPLAEVKKAAEKGNALRVLLKERVLPMTSSW